MVEFQPYPTSMPHDFELYSNQEQHFDFPPTTQPFPPSQYHLGPSYSATFDNVNMPALSGPPRQQDLHFHYNGIAQGVKPTSAFQYSPQGSPNSASHSLEHPPVLTASSESGASVSSSNTGSPSLHPQFTGQCGQWNAPVNGLGIPILQGTTSGFEYETLVVADKAPGCVDPSLISPYAFQYPHSPYHDIGSAPSPFYPAIEQPPSPALSQLSARSPAMQSNRLRHGSQSPYLNTQQFQPYPVGTRRKSDASLHSQRSAISRRSGSSYDLDEETREKGQCPLPECGRVFKDLKAHMLTHQEERPEKCPIATCDYHHKGFARKYDKNRHTLTHYKGTMVCGSAQGLVQRPEKSFNRADVFKRHLTSVHGVEQSPPNSRKKASGSRKVQPGQHNGPGICSTCKVLFPNAQEFYEHLDECVLRVVQQADPSEAINQRILTSVAEDHDVTETLDRNGLSNSVEYTVPSFDADEEEEDEDEDVEAGDQNDDLYGARRPRTGKGSVKSTKND